MQLQKVGFKLSPKVHETHLAIILKLINQIYHWFIRTASIIILWRAIKQVNNLWTGIVSIMLVTKQVLQNIQMLNLWQMLQPTNSWIRWQIMVWDKMKSSKHTQAICFDHYNLNNYLIKDSNWCIHLPTLSFVMQLTQARVWDGFAFILKSWFKTLKISSIGERLVQLTWINKWRSSMMTTSTSKIRLTNSSSMSSCKRHRINCWITS